MKYNEINIENSVIDTLKNLFGFDLVTHTFIPVGEESYAFSVLLSDENKYFVKYCDKPDIIKNINLVNVLLLQLRHFDFIVPPVEINRTTSFKVGRGKIYIYPYIEGTVVNQGNDKFDKEFVDKLTKIMADIHTATPHISVNLPKEEFTNNYEMRLNQIPTVSKEDEKTIRRLIKKQDNTADKYKRMNLNFVLTHGDITGLNIIITSENNIKLVDWDGAMFTPPERDINFLFDNPNFSLDKYLQLSGQTIFNPEIEEYYSRQWALDSIIENFESLLNDGKSKANRDEYIEEIKRYLDKYK